MEKTQNKKTIRLSFMNNIWQTIYLLKITDLAISKCYCYSVACDNSKMLIIPTHNTVRKYRNVVLCFVALFLHYSHSKEEIMRFLFRFEDSEQNKNRSESSFWGLWTIFVQKTIIVLPVCYLVHELKLVCRGGLPQLCMRKKEHHKRLHWHIWNSWRHTLQSYGPLIHFTAMGHYSL